MSDTSDDAPLKSAYELAMERLRKEDAERGEEVRPLTDEQKEEIARLRREAQAKIAELEIMHEQKLAAAGGDPEKLAEAEEKLKIDRGRVESSTESKIERIKRG
jgi:hypothetical protein